MYLVQLRYIRIAIIRHDKIECPHQSDVFAMMRGEG